MKKQKNGRSNQQRWAEKVFEKVQHYHVYTQNMDNGVVTNQLAGTVAVGMLPTGVVCRGISICSVTENFSRGKGMKWAIKRLLSAVDQGANSEPIQTVEQRKENESRVDEAALSVERFAEAFRQTEGHFPFAWKVCYDTTLTPKEEKILADKQ